MELKKLEFTPESGTVDTFMIHSRPIVTIHFVAQSRSSGNCEMPKKLTFFV